MVLDIRPASQHTSVPEKSKYMTIDLMMEAIPPQQRRRTEPAIYKWSSMNLIVNFFADMTWEV